jgi:hypothetical protein
VGQSIESLPLPERLEAYRHFAEEAFRKAHDAGNDEASAEFFAMAARWHLLAVEVERAMKAADLASSPNDEEPDPIADAATPMGRDSR